jgi:hypothetical protein
MVDLNAAAWRCLTDGCGVPAVDGAWRPRVVVDLLLLAAELERVCCEARGTHARLQQSSDEDIGDGKGDWD